MDGLDSPTSSVLQALGTVLVVTVVAGSRQERLTHVVGGHVELNGIETVGLQALCQVDDHLLPRLNLLGGIVADEGLGVVKRADGCAHGVELIAHVCAVGMERRDEPLHVVCIVILLEGACRHVPEVGEVLNPNHLDAALGHALVIGKVLIGIGVEEGKLESGRLHHAMMKFDGAEFPV